MRSAAALQSRKAGNGRTARAWDDLEQVADRWERRLEREGLGVLGFLAGTHIRDADAVAERITGTVWEMSAAIDQLLAALHRYPFKNQTDRRICELLSQRIPWWRVARVVRCSKRRVSEVNRRIKQWRDPDVAADRYQGGHE